MEALAESNFEQTAGYGEDRHCENAARLIRGLIGDNNAAVHFTVGGTQTNTIAVKAALRPHQGVICADSGHINVHESGAIESTGHKVLALRSEDGKITAAQIEECVEAHFGDATHEHQVQPAMVYLSFPTEVGTLYSKRELEAISAVCREKGLALYVDCARMGYGLESDKNDLLLSDFARLCDMFYIGGTKVGCLFGEALVIVNDSRYIIKQQGGLLAKGRLLGVQFEELFKDGLYARLSRHAPDCAAALEKGLADKGFDFLFKSPTNQIFPIMHDSLLDKISKDFAFSYRQRVDESHSAVRFCTSRATEMKNVEKLLKSL